MQILLACVLKLFNSYLPVTAREGMLQGWKIFKNDHKIFKKFLLTQKVCVNFFQIFGVIFLSLQNFFRGVQHPLIATAIY
jgi:hypothetical protein